MQSNYHSSRIQDRIWMNVSISTYEISFIITSVVGKKKNLRGAANCPNDFLETKKAQSHHIFYLIFDIL